MIKDEILLKLQQSKYWDLVTDNNAASNLFIYCGGSRLVGLDSDTSDYDLVVVRKGTTALFEPHRLKYGDTTIHWYRRNIGNFIKSENASNLILVGLMELSYVDSSNLMYVSEQGLEVLKIITDESHNLRQIGCRKYFKFLKDYAAALVSSTDIAEKYYSKTLGHLLFASYAVRDEALNKDLIIAAKKCKYNGLTETQRLEILKQLRLGLEFIKANEFDEEAEANRIQGLVDEIVGKNV